MVCIQTLQLYETGIVESRESTSFILKGKNMVGTNIYNL